MDALPSKPLNDMSIQDYINQFNVLPLDEFEKLHLDISILLLNLKDKLGPFDDGPDINLFAIEGVGRPPDFEDFVNNNDNIFPFGQMNIWAIKSISIHMVLSSALGLLQRCENPNSKWYRSKSKSELLKIKVMVMKLVDQQKTNLELTKKSWEIVRDGDGKFALHPAAKGPRPYAHPLSAFLLHMQQEWDGWSEPMFSETNENSVFWKLCTYAENKYGKEVKLHLNKKNTLKSLATATGGIGVGALGTYGVMSGGGK
jgi:hypothetical protein